MESITLEFRGVDLAVEYRFIPGEKGVMYYGDMTGCPDEPDRIDVHEITFKGFDVYSLFRDRLDEIESQIMNECFTY